MGVCHDYDWGNWVVGLYAKYRAWEMEDPLDQYNLVEYFASRDYYPPGWKLAFDISHGDLRHAAAIEQLNTGYGIINQNDHSGPYAMGVGYSTSPKEVLGSLDILGLTNGSKYGIMYSGGCEPAPFQTDDCIGEQWLLNPNGGGVAFIGSSIIRASSSNV